MRFGQINEAFFNEQIYSLRVKKEFLEQQNYLFQLNGFPEIHSFLNKEIRVVIEMIRDYENDKKLFAEIHNEKMVVME